MRHALDGFDGGSDAVPWHVRKRAELGLPPLTDAETWAWRCADCGVYLGDRRAVRYTYRDCPDCRRVARERTRDASRRAAWDTIPAHFRWARFDADLLAARIDAGEARVVAGRMADAPGALAVLYGRPGAGKTSAACAILARWVETSADGASARYVTSRAIGRADRDGWLGAEPPILGECRAASMLVVDEIGSEPFGWEAVRDLIIDRHAAERPTIMATWLDLAQLAQRYGEGLARRVTVTGTFRPVVGGAA